jgi:hypothetical protein
MISSRNVRIATSTCRTTVLPGGYDDQRTEQGGDEAQNHGDAQGEQGRMMGQR